jgi:hypothetical protein
MYNLRRFSTQIRTLSYVASPAAVGTDADTTAWVAAVVGNGGTVSGGRQTLVNSLIVGLKADGVWSKLDRLWLTAAEDTVSALTDLVATSLATAINSPTFTVDRGYEGEDAAVPTKYINSNYTPGTNYSLNSAHFSTWCVTNIAQTQSGSAMGSGASGTNLYLTFTDGNIYARISDSPESGSQGAPPSLAGHVVVNRSGASASEVYRNGSLFSSPNASAGSVATTDFALLCLNVTPAGGNSNQFAAFTMGGSLTAAEAGDFYSHLRTYMTAVGVP